MKKIMVSINVVLIHIVRGGLIMYRKSLLSILLLVTSLTSCSNITKDVISYTVDNFDKNKIVENYLRKNPEPFEIRSDGRIKVVD